MTNVNLELVVRNLMAKGPSRVMVSKTKSTTWRVATTQFHIDPTIIFIRHDGWTLAANEKLERAAYDTWPKDWVSFLRKPSEVAQPIVEYLCPDCGGAFCKGECHDEGGRVLFGGG